MKITFFAKCYVVFSFDPSFRFLLIPHDVFTTRSVLGESKEFSGAHRLQLVTGS